MDISKEINKTNVFDVTVSDREKLVKDYELNETRLQELLKKYNTIGLSSEEKQEYTSIKSYLWKLIGPIENLSRGRS